MSRFMSGHVTENQARGEGTTKSQQDRPGGELDRCTQCLQAGSEGQTNTHAK